MERRTVRLEALRAACLGGVGGAVVDAAEAYEAAWRAEHARFTRLLAERIGGERPLLVALALKPGHDASRKELLARAIELCTAQ